MGTICVHFFPSQQANFLNIIYEKSPLLDWIIIPKPHMLLATELYTHALGHVIL